jgi:hypothetical protein
MTSFYFRNPDGSLIEVCCYEAADRPTPYYHAHVHQSRF